MSHAQPDPETIRRAQALISDPVKRKLAREFRLKDCREKIRAGNEESLWEYIGLQWPGVVFDDFQKTIITAGMMGSVTEIAIKGCTKPGKGFAVAVLINCWFDVHQESKIVITSSSIDHAEKVMFGEVTAVRLMMKNPGPGNVMMTQLQDTTKHYLVVVNPTSPESFSGQHGPFTLFVMDEASGVPDELYDAARKQARLIVALFNPRTLSGWARDMFRPAEDQDKTQTIMTDFGERLLVTVGGADCRNVKEKRLEKPIAPPGGITIRDRDFRQGQRIPPDYYEDVKLLIPNQMDFARYRSIMSSPDEFTRRVFGEGKFPKEDAEAQLFLQSWFERHHKAHETMEQEGSPVEVEAFSLDIAASVDGDESILTAGGLQGIRRQHGNKKLNTMATIGWVFETCEQQYGIDLKEGRVPIAVDAGGIGKSVCDTLEELGVNVIRCINNAAPTMDRDRYANFRAELFGEFSRRLNPEESPEPFAIPRDPKLVQELCVHCKITLARGFRITPKDKYPGQKVDGHTIREQLGRSPDRADSACLLWVAARSLDMGQIPTLNRPLVMLTMQDEIEAATAEMDEFDALPPEKQIMRQLQRKQDEWQTYFDDLMEIPLEDRMRTGKDGKMEPVVGFPDFL